MPSLNYMLRVVTPDLHSNRSMPEVKRNGNSSIEGLVSDVLNVSGSMARDYKIENREWMTNILTSIKSMLPEDNFGTFEGGT